ncbi:hypothetical protein SOVF_047900 [Spinacia oleracea]|uniref:Transcription factor bHLH143 n=1 Tax=Spinacia oleracea TaxID=3562 RepID=A0A9R0K8P0_SPIOL|nr:transcription factor bHLH143-like [Spinacia oleracea]KNA20924.1 hypothetical protein SOVF_047900 [Spinacia oleracea]
MEKDFESWLHQREPDLQFPNAKPLKLPFGNLGMQNTGIPSATPCANAALPSFGFTGQPNFKMGQPKEPHGWFYCLPRFRQGLVPDSTLHDNKFMGGLVPDSTLHDNKFIPEVDFPGKASPDAGRGPKQFLVFDRTGNKTTLILSSMMGGATNHPPLNSWNQNKPKNVKEGGEVGNGSDDGLQFHSGTVNLTDDLDNNNDDDDDDDNEISEMHEDSEDIDALLSSDCYSEDDVEDDEETSTGHSPIATITAYNEKQDWFHENGDTDEVASSVGPTKRRKLSSTTYNTLKHKELSEYEDDAESSCIGPDHWAGIGPDRAGTKKDRKEKIRETVSILQTILPVGGGDGKDAVVVLDEAINYLKKLRYEARSLGISGL